MSKVTKEEMKLEALSRINSFVKQTGLNPNVYNYFQEGGVFYSYLTANGLLGSIDRISYDPSYEAAVKTFEKRYEKLVYHCVESDIGFGKNLIMLYVGNDNDYWEQERPSDDGVVMANVWSVDEDFDEIGYVKLSSFQGALVRVG